MIVNLVVGDRWDDGHGKTATFTYEVTGAETLEEVAEAHKAGCKELGIELDRFGEFPYCEEYEDDSFPKEIAEKLGLSDYNDTDEEMIGLFPSAFSEVYIKIVQVARPDISFKEIKGQELDIGGYGLFY